jgi:hypothetical protein
VSSYNEKDRVFELIIADLDPTPLAAHTKIGLATVLGGLLSLAVCGQFGFGFTGLAHSVNHHLHEAMGPLRCAIICGAMYALFPVLILRILFCSPIQFRALMRNRQSVWGFWYFVFGGTLMTTGHHEPSIIAFSGWVIAAILTANLGVIFLNYLLPQWECYSRIKAVDRI